jgi:hypothetical protein
MTPVVKLASDFKTIAQASGVPCAMQLNNTSHAGMSEMHCTALHLVRLLS